MKRTDTPVNPVQARTDARERRRRRRGRSGLAGFIGKYFLLFSALMVVMVVVDFVLYVAISLYAMQGGADDVTGPTQLSTRICSALEPQEDGSFDLAPEIEQRLDREGVVRGVDEHGRLIVEDEWGVRHAVASGEAHLR